MRTHRGSDGSMVGVPPLLTVEEAASLLRIGRTKAYAMTREWRETDGRSGLPVVDLGNVLRVPREAIEDLIGADLSIVTIPTGARATENSSRPRGNSKATTRPPSRNTDQLDLFEPTIGSDNH